LIGSNRLDADNDDCQFNGKSNFKKRSINVRNHQTAKV